MEVGAAGQVFKGDCGVSVVGIAIVVAVVVVVVVVTGLFWIYSSVFKIFEIEWLLIGCGREEEEMVKVVILDTKLLSAI